MLLARALRTLALVVFGIVAVVAFVVLLGSGRASALGLSTSSASSALSSGVTGLVGSVASPSAPQSASSSVGTLVTTTSGALPTPSSTPG